MNILEQLSQLRTVTWDGNLISKEARDMLVKLGLAQRIDGWNWLTDTGVQVAIERRLLQP